MKISLDKLDQLFVGTECRKLLCLNKVKELV